ncbi:MAG: UDP-N-acetylmuramate--L-alanine ligase [Bacteroidales bacterium]|nr:UDP-N-acetylmuramate--L-alanine ligase [Bacteroidales bacterium]MCL2133234.1 UDP-N-acetylmuramate--L-alanine ligase [Bacteroidales bacterium]
MSALARYYKHAGAEVVGYDRTPSPLTAELEKEGIAVHYEDNVSLIPDNFKQTANKALVIYTPAVPAEHSELQFFRQNDYQVIKRSAALGQLAANKDTLAVAGTHAKTTTSTLLAHLLTQAADGCTAFLGGVSKNYNTNLLCAHTRALVAEADEFDRSFLQLFPKIAVVTSADPDHLDIYETSEALKQAFVDFIHQIKPDGTLIIKEGVELPFTLTADQKLYRYSFDKICDFYAANIQLQTNGLMQFDIHYPAGVLKACTLGILGRVNVENAVAATAAAWAYGADMELLKKALADFSGVQRRFDVQINQPNCTYIDDYAHHPEELKAAITSLRETYPRRKIIGVFQPHLYTRTRDFAPEFSESLSLLDKLILLDIYPARELPIEGVSSQLIFDKVKITDKRLCTKDELLPLLEMETIDILVTFGAGDIDRFVAPIKEMLNNKLKTL